MFCLSSNLNHRFYFINPNTVINTLSYPIFNHRKLKRKSQRNIYKKISQDLKIRDKIRKISIDKILRKE
jgi:hypothetical protein